MIHYGDPIGSTAYGYPTTPAGLEDVWDRIGVFKGHTVAMISPRHFVFVNHVASSVGDRLVIGGSVNPVVFSDGFESSVSGWTADPGSGGAATVTWNAGGWLDYTVSTWVVGSRFSASTPVAGGLGKAMRVKLRAKASTAVGISVELHNGSYQLQASVNLTTAWQTFVFEVASPASGPTSACGIYITALASIVGTVSVDDIEIRVGDCYTTTAKASSGDVCVYTLDRDVPDLEQNLVRKPRWFRCAAFDGDAATERETFIFGRFTPKTSVLTGGSGTQGWNVGAVTEQLCWGRQGLPLRVSGTSASARFDADQGGYEVGIHIGDSGCPFLILQNGEWRLAAIGYAVDSLLWGTTYGGRQNAVVFNMNGLYGSSASPVATSGGQLNLHHSVSGYRGFITGIVPDAFDFFSKPLGEEVKRITVN